MWFEQKSSEYYQNINKAWIIDDVFAKIGNGNYQAPMNLRQEMDLFFQTKGEIGVPVIYCYLCDDKRGTTVSDNRMHFKIIVKDTNDRVLNTFEKDLFHAKHPMLI